MSQYAVKLRRERARLADETEVGGQISSGGTRCQETTPSQWENPVSESMQYARRAGHVGPLSVKLSSLLLRI